MHMVPISQPPYLWLSCKQEELICLCFTSVWRYISLFIKNKIASPHKTHISYHPVPPLSSIFFFMKWKTLRILLYSFLRKIKSNEDWNLLIKWELIFLCDFHTILQSLHHVTFQIVQSIVISKSWDDTQRGNIVKNAWSSNSLPGQDILIFSNLYNHLCCLYQNLFPNDLNICQKTKIKLISKIAIVLIPSLSSKCW